MTAGLSIKPLAFMGKRDFAGRGSHQLQRIAVA